MLNKMVEKIVHLNALDLDVSVPKNINFQDLGITNCLPSTYREICRKHNVESIREEEEDLLHCRGAHFFLKHEEIIPEEGFLISKNIFYSYIFYRELSSQTASLITRSHEETHFLDAHDNLHILSSEIRERVGVNIDFEKLKEEQQGKRKRREVIAEIGARFAIHQRYGFDFLKQEKGFVSNKYAVDAWRIYYQSYQDSLNLSRMSCGKGLSRILNLLE